MHVHTASTTLSKVEEALAELLPPSGTRSRYGVTEPYDDDLVDLRVHYLGGRDVLAVAVHADHDAEPRTAVAEGLVRVEHYGPDHRHFETEGGAALPPDSAGLVEDVRRTWALWFGQDGRPTSLWLYRGADGEVIGDPIRLDAPVDGDLAVDPVEELLEAIRLTQEYAQFPAVDGWSWWDVYKKYRPADAERLREEAERANARTKAPARTVTIRRQADGRDRFAFLNDDGHLVGEFVVEPRHVTLVHDRAVPPEWSGVWPQ